MSTADEGMSPEPLSQLPAGVRHVLCELAYGWHPSPVELRNLEHLSYRGTDLTEYVERLSIDGGRLVATLNIDEPDVFSTADMDAALEATLQDGTRVSAEHALKLGRQVSISKDAGLAITVTLEMDNWRIQQPLSPLLWIGQVAGMRGINFSGNLVVERTRPGAPVAWFRRHFLLSGAYSYYFVQYKQRNTSDWYLVVDTKGASTLDRELLGRDFLVLEFVLGRQMRLEQLLGVTANQCTVACVPGFDRRQHLQERSVPPVPIERNNDGWVDLSWVPDLFARISAAWRQLPQSDNSYWIALDMYLDAMQLHLDFDYMRLQIGLEAFAFWHLRRSNNGDPLDVTNQDAWGQWVRDNREAIRAHALPGREDALVQKVKGAARLASGNVVRTAFASFGIALQKELRQELRGRDVIVHQGLMAPDGYEADRDLRRVSLIRTMLVALVACSAGYRGAINGPAIGGLGDPIEQGDWWTVSEQARGDARRVFLIEEEYPQEGTRESGGQASEE